MPLYSPAASKAPNRNLATYSASIAGLAFQSGATNIFEIQAPSSKVAHVVRVTFSAIIGSTAAVKDILLYQQNYPSANGTSTTITAGKHRSTDPAATAVVKAYTANPDAPSGGQTQTQARGNKYTALTASSASPDIYQIVWTFDYPLTLQTISGTAQALAVNLNGATWATTNGGDLTVTFVEE